ncbi:hypothetical protein ACJX0J_034784 [Zea mays]
MILIVLAFLFAGSGWMAKMLDVSISLLAKNLFFSFYFVLDVITFHYFNSLVYWRVFGSGATVQITITFYGLYTRLTPRKLNGPGGGGGGGRSDAALPSLGIGLG